MKRSKRNRRNKWNGWSRRARCAEQVATATFTDGPRFEPLEERMLLSAGPGGLDLVLTVDRHEQWLQVVDANNKRDVLQQASIGSTDPFVISGSADSDRLRFDVPRNVAYAGLIVFDGFGGDDVLVINGKPSGVLRLDDFGGENGTIKVSGSTIAHDGVEHIELTKRAKQLDAIRIQVSADGDELTLSHPDDDTKRLRVSANAGPDLTMFTRKAAVVVDTGDGDDTVTIATTHMKRLELTIEAGDGDDVIAVTGSDLNLAELTLLGEAGDDRIELGDGILRRSLIEISGAEGADALVIGSLVLKRTELAVDGDAGDDRIELGDGILRRSLIEISGAEGADALVIGSLALGRTELIVTGDGGDDGIEWEGGKLRRSTVEVAGGDDADTLVIGSLDLRRTGLVVDGGGGDDVIDVDGIARPGPRTSLIGGHGTDTLVGTAAGSLWHLTGLDLGEINGVAFDAFEHLTGSDTGADRFTIAAGADLTGVITGGSGNGDVLAQEYGGPHLTHELGGYAPVFRVAGTSIIHHHAGIDSFAYVSQVSVTQTVSVGDSANVRVTQDDLGQIVITHSYPYGDVVSAEDEAYVVGGAASSWLGASVTRVGDLNADGYEDVVIGAAGADTAYLLFGSATGLADNLDLTALDGTDGVALVGSSGSLAGTSLAAAGDVNGDGIDDLIVGAPGMTAGAVGGYAAVVFGCDSVFGATIDLESLDGTDGFRVLGASADDGLGTAVAGLGDFNGDQIADIAVGAPASDANGADAGSTYIVLGGETGFAATIDVSALDGSNGLAMHGESAGHGLGSALAGGDLDDDGLADVAMGAAAADSGAGKVYVYVGRITDLAATVDLSTLTGVNGFVVNGSTAGDGLGSSLTAGDVDSDATDDLLMAAPGAAMAYAIFGTQDNHSASYDAGAIDGTMGMVIDASSLADTTGMTVALVGDLNGDTVSEIAVSAPMDTGSTGSGSVFVFYGNSDNRSGEATPTTLSVDALDGSNGFRVDGSTSGDAVGSAVSGADLNGDGFSDLVVGAPAANSGAGKLIVLDGRLEGGAEILSTYDLPTQTFTIKASGDNSGAKVSIGLKPPGDASTAVPNRIDMGAADLVVDLRHGSIYGNSQPSKVRVEAATTVVTDTVSGRAGEIKLAATQVALDAGSQLIADGDVALLAENIVDDSPFQTDELPEIVEAISGNKRRLATVEVASGVTIYGADVTIDATSGDRNITSIISQALGGFGTAGTLGGAGFNALLGLASDVFSLPASVILRASTAKVTIGDGTGPVSIDGSDSVAIGADATADAVSNAVFWGYEADLTSYGFALSVAQAIATAEVDLTDGVSITSAGDVSVTGTATTELGSNARVSQNIGKSPIPNATAFPADPDAKFVSVAYGYTQPTAHVTVAGGATIEADGVVGIESIGTDTNHTEATGAAYSDGQAGVTFTFAQAKADIQAIVNGSVTAGVTANADASTTFNPFTAVDYESDTLVLGKGHGFKTGDRLYYDPGDGAGAVDGLTARTTYYVIIPANTSDAIQLAASAADAEAGAAIDLLAQPVLTADDETQIALGRINSVDDLIEWTFEHGIADGTALTYTAAANKTVPGLTDSQTYYAIVGDDATSMGLAETSGGGAVDLGVAPTFTVNATSQVLTVENLDGVNSIITFTEDHGLSAGDAITYHGAFGTTLIDDATGEPITDGVYYAVTVYNDDGTVATDKVRLASSALAATVSDTYDGLIEFTVGADDVTGTSHTLADQSTVGLRVDATLSNDHAFKSDSRVGKSLGKAEPLTKGELIGNLLDTAASIKAGAAAAYSAISDWWNDKASDKSQDAQNGNAPGGANVDASPDTVDLAAAGTVWRSDSTVQAIVGSTAQLASNAGTDVSASTSQLLTVSTEGVLTQGKRQNGAKFAMGGGVSIGGTDHTVRAIVNDGARIDSRGLLNVGARAVYPFRVPIQDPEQFGEYLYTSLKNELTTLVGQAFEEVSFIQDAVFNTWTRAVSRLTDATVAAAVTFDYNWRDGDVRAIIAEGAQINQNGAYQNPGQSVNVRALTRMNIVSAGGIFDIKLNPTGAVYAALKKSTDRLYAPMGSTGQEGGLGVGVLWQRQDLTTRAGVGLLSLVDDAGKKIDDPTSSGNTTRVRTGDDGLTIDTDEHIFFLQYLQTGASVSGQSGFVFDGGASIVDYTGHATAAIAGGTTVTGGLVHVDATSQVDGLGMNGDIASGGALGVGAAVSVWSVDRTTKAYLGEDNTGGDSGDSRDPLDIDSVADVLVRAHNAGGIYVLSLAAAVTSAAPRENPENQDYGDDSDQPIVLRNDDNDSVDDDQNAQLGDGAGSKSPAFGLAVSADVAVLELADKVYAFIDDSGSISADAVDVKASNTGNAWAVAGALAIAQNGEAKTSAAMAGSFAEMSLFGNVTSALINGATVTAAAGLSVDARRKGNITAASAGGSVQSRNNLDQVAGVSLTGSAAITDVRQNLKARITGATLNLGADSSINADDGLTMQTIAGGLDIGGKLGFGGSLAYTHINANANASVDNSTITQTGGGLTIDAKMGDTGNSRVIAAAATAGASPDGVVLGATVVLTDSNQDSDDPAVAAAMTGGSYTSTGSSTSSGDGELSITAADETSYQAAAGAVTVDGKIALDYAYAENRLKQKAHAALDGSSVTTTKAGGVTVDAKTKVGAQAYALGAVAQADAAAIAGSIAVNKVTRDAQATIGDGLLVNVAGDVAVGSALATAGSPNAGVIIGVAGAFGDVTGAAAGAAGAAVVENVVTDAITATIAGASTVSAGGTADVSATNGTGAIVGVAVGLDRAQQFTLGGSVVTNNIDATTTAGVAGAAALTSGGDVFIAADEADAEIVASAGQLVGSGGTVAGSGVAVGAAVATNTGKSVVTAMVDGAAVKSTGGSASVTADRENSLLTTLAVGGASAGSFAGAGSAATNSFTHNTSAEVSDGASLAGSSGASVGAAESGVSYGAGAGSVTLGKIAISTAEATNAISNNIRASVGQKDATETTDDSSSLKSTGGAVSVTASKTDTVSVAVAVSGEGAESAAVGGSIAVQDMTRTLDAHVAGAAASGTDVTIDADFKGGTTVVVAGNLDVGLASKLGNGDDGGPEPQVEQRDGLLDPVDEAANDEANPLAQQERVWRISDSFSSDYRLSDSVDDSGVDSDPKIDGSEPESDIEPPGPGAAAATSIAFGAAIASNYTDNTVIAAANGSDLTASAGDVAIDATLSEMNTAATGAGVGAGKSTLTGAAAASINQVTHTVDAYIDGASENDSQISADGTVSVNADSAAHLYTVAGNASVTESTASLGISIADTVHMDKTRSYIDNAEVNAYGGQDSVTVKTADGDDKVEDDDFTGVSVTATSREVVTTIAAGVEVSGAGGSGLQVASSMSAVSLDETTTATIKSGATVVASPDSADTAHVNVFAYDETTTLGAGGAIGISGAQTLGLGISADVGNITKSTIAQVSGAYTGSHGNLSVQALSREKISSYEGTLEAGKGGVVAATAGVYLLDLTTLAFIDAEDGSDTAPLVESDGSVLVSAHGRTHLFQFVGSVDGGFSDNLNAGATLGYSHVRKQTEAYLGANVNDVNAQGLGDFDAVTALADGFDITFEDPDGDGTRVQAPELTVADNIGSGGEPISDETLQKNRVATARRTSVRGIAVSATNSDVISSQAYSIGLSQGSGFDGSGSARTGTSIARASIEAPKVTARPFGPATQVSGDLLVTASQDYHRLSITGAVTLAEQTAATPALDWTSITLDTEAEVGDDVSVQTGGDTRVTATSTQRFTSAGVGLSATFGNAAIDGSAGITDITGTTRARIGAGASVNANGSVEVAAQDDTTVTSIAGGLAFAATPLKSAAVDASFSYVNVVKNTEAVIDAGAAVIARAQTDTKLSALAGDAPASGSLSTQSVTGVAVTALSSETLNSDAISGALTGGVGVSGAVLYTHVHSDTTAKIGNGAAINRNVTDAAASQGVYVTAGNDVKATNIAGGVTAGIGVLGGGVDVGIVRNDTVATIGDNAIINAEGDLGVHAVTRRDVKTTTVSSADGFGGIAGSVAVWALGRQFDSSYDTVTTTGNDALAPTTGKNGEGAAYGSIGAYADARANRGDVADSLGGYEADPDAAGGQLHGRDVTVGSQRMASIGDTASGNLADAVDALSGNATATITQADESNTTAEVLGSATAGTGVTIGGDVAVTTADRIKLDMHTGSVSADVVGVGASISVAKLRGGGNAYVGGRIAAGGAVNVSSDSTHHLNGTAVAAELGVVNAVAAVTVLEDSSQQQAQLATGAQITAADSVNVTASQNYDKFETEASDGGLAGVIAGAAVAQSKSLGAVRSFAGDAVLGSQASPLTGPVTFSATFTPDSHPKATANAISVGIGTGDGTRADAVFRPEVEAWFGGGTNAAKIWANDNVDVLATTTAKPYAEALGLNVGVIGTIGASQAYSTAGQNVIAYVADNATIKLPGAQANLKVTAQSGTDALPDDPFAHGRASGGGAIVGVGVDAKATIQPTIKAYIGDGAVVSVGESVLVTAEQVWAGFAHASGGDYGGLTVGANNATLDVQPEVTAYINAEQIDAAGVNVQAEAGEAGTLSHFTFDSATGVDYANNQIRFDQPHGLQDGDQIVYTANDTPIGGLDDGETYTVRVIDDRTVQFVYMIETDDVDPQSNQLVSSTGPHPLSTGAGVIYDANGGPAIGGLTHGHTYYVNAVDPTTLWFATSPQIADNLYMTNVSVPSANVDTDWAVVPYLTSTVPGSAFVGSAESGEDYLHNFTSDPNWSDGDLVVYFADSNTTISSLTVGGGYYVRQSDTHDNRWHLYDSATDYSNDDRIKFHDNHTGRFAKYTESDWYVAGSSTRSPDTFFQGGAVNPTDDTITFAGSPPIATGDVVSITPQNHMIDFGAPFELYYYAHVTHSGGNTIVKLALSQADLNSGTYIDFVGQPGLGENYTLGRPFKIETSDKLTYNGSLDFRFSASDINPDGTITIDSSDATELLNDLIALGSNGKLVYDVVSTYADATPLAQLTIGHEYAFTITVESPDSLTIDLTGIQLSSTEDTSGGAPTQHVLRLGKDHVPIDGLIPGRDYYLVKDSSEPGRYGFATTPANAANGHLVDLFPTASVKIASTSHDITAINYDNNTVTVADGSSITTGQQLTYHAADNKWIIGVSGGHTYYAINHGNGVISFADSAADANNGVARNLAKVARLTDASETVHGVTIDADNDTLTLTNTVNLLATGDAVTYQGVFDQLLVGVNKGLTYYVVRADPDDPTVIRLAETYEEAITSDGRSNTIRFYVASSVQDRSIGTQFIGIGAIDLATPDTASTQYFVVDLTDDGSTGTQSFGPPEPAADDADPPAPTVQASASNGALIAAVGSLATANIKPVVAAFIGSPDGAGTSAPAVINADDLFIGSTSYVDVKAKAFDYAVGVLVGIGSAQTVVDIHNMSTSYIGADAAVTLSRDATVAAVSGETVESRAITKGGAGVVDSDHSKSTVDIGRATTATVGAGADITAAGDVAITAGSATAGNSTVKSHANGTITLPTPRSIVNIGTDDTSGAQTSVTIGNSAELTSTGGKITLDAAAEYGRFDSCASDKSHDVYSNDKASADLLIAEDSRVTLGSDATLTAALASTIDALLSWDALTAVSKVSTRALAESSHASAELLVDGGAGLHGSLAGTPGVFTTAASVTGPTSGDGFKEHHKVTTSWLWIKSKSHSGGSATNTTTTISQF